ncbi:DNA-binding transcriptional LysR family regulator/ABC-type branched-subunit amino acid transport system substrate-binding protein [Beijerinckia sp. GAS462]|nr:DNA-binding transcriptional LysR family regulator/ABC-type branched-subunit amino acid transport system substrate-binding protein [Beijerinckia sp. GAS462]SED46479.1 ABC-type branched-chain amino acid transport system, substrate-binding protein [Beijerinckia sp. 28-YEA-48]
MTLLASRLTIRHLRMVVAIVEEGNLVRAAERLNMTQSAVTKALQETEALTGTRLFDRTNRGVVTTVYGEALAFHARLIIAQLAHAEEHLADLRDGAGGRVAVGTLLSASAELLPTAIARLRKERPKLVVKLVEATDDVLLPALRSGELDLVVGRLSEQRDRLNVTQEVLMDDIACVVARHGHPLTMRRAVSLADLIGWEWILPPAQTSLRRLIDMAFREEGLEPPTHAVESVSLLANRALLIDADYLGVLPASVARREVAGGGLTILPVTLEVTESPIGITTRSHVRLSPAAQLLIGALRRTAADLSSRDISDQHHAPGGRYSPASCLNDEFSIYRAGDCAKFCMRGLATGQPCEGTTCSVRDLGHIPSSLPATASQCEEGTETMRLKGILPTALLALGVSAASAQQPPLKVGMITTLSGPAGYLGQDIRDGFQLAIDLNKGALGGRNVQLVVEDDSLKPGNAKQIASKMLSEQGIKIFTGVVFANVAFAAVPEILDSNAIYVSANTASATFAGKECHPNYFVSSWQDDSQGESAGALAQSLGYKRAFLVAPNYQAGKETMEAFKRFYKGAVVGEAYTGLDQTDFAVVMAQIRAAKPDVVYEFEPGGLGIAFLRQYQQSGLLKEIPMVVHPASLDQAIAQAVGDAAIGVKVTSHWNEDFDNPINKTFVAAWRAKYGDRPITYYAAQGYDAALLIGAGLAKDPAGGDNPSAFRKALLAANIPSVRGPFKFGPNQHPIQDWYALKAERAADGKMVLKTDAKVLTAHGDSYSGQCKAPAN